MHHAPKGRCAAAASMRHLLLVTTTAAAALALPIGAAHAQDAPSSVAPARSFNIPAQSLATALRMFTEQSGVQVAYTAQLGADVRSAGVSGSFAPAEALLRLLTGTGVTFRWTSPNTVVLERAPQSADSAIQLGPVRVEGQGGSGGGRAIPPQAIVGNLPPEYAGGQVARGTQLGILGNLDFMETPFSATAYTERRIEDIQANDIGGVIGATDPSVYVPQTLGLHESFLMRGFRVSSDDVSFNGLFGIAPYQRGSTEMVERMEVLKGPSAMLRGMPPFGSVGGSINMVPKRAGEEPLTRLTASYASDSQFGVHVDVGRRFGADDQFGVRVNGVFRYGSTAVDHQEHKMMMGSLGLDWRGERVRVSADIYRQRERLDGIDYFGINSIASTVTRLPPPFKGDTNLAAPWLFNISNTTAAIARIEWDVTDEVTAFAAFGWRDSDYDALIAQGRLLNDAGDFSASLIRQYTMAKLYTGEVGLRGRTTTGPIAHNWSLIISTYDNKGGFRNIRGRTDAEWLRRYNIYALNFGNPPNLSGFSTAGVLNSGRNEMDGVALADRMSFADDIVQLTLGARWQSINNTAIGATGVRYDGSVYKKTAVSPSGALLVKVSPQLSVYGSYAQGLTQGGTAPLGTINAGERLPPYNSKQHELGAKYDLGTLAVTAALFQITLPSAYTDPATNTYAANGQQRNRGAELNVFGEPARGFRVIGGVTYIEAELRNQLVRTNNGNQATGIPKFIGKLGAEYDLATIPGLTVTGRINHAGKRFATADNRLSLSAYTTFDLGARFAADLGGTPVVFRANIENLTNKAYWGGSWSGSGDSGLSGGFGPPRTFRASASVDF